MNIIINYLEINHKVMLRPKDHNNYELFSVIIFDSIVIAIIVLIKLHSRQAQLLLNFPKEFWNLK